MVKNNEDLKGNVEVKEIDFKDGIYIPSIEACWLYKAYKETENYEVNEEYLDKLLKGKLDYSFELVMDEELIKNIEVKEKDGKLYSFDVINVKYNNKYKNKNEEKTTRELRDWTYANGVKFNGKLLTNWKRSTGKARNGGQDLFLIDTIKDKCLAWARMNLDFSKGNIDIGSIRAYESLPLSSIIGTIEINPNGILVIDDFKSKFDWNMSKTWLENGVLQTKTDITDEENSIWDGQGLLSDKIFEENELIRGKGVALLRNRLMKCAGFCCYIEKFFRDYCDKHGYDYETYEIEDMYGNKIKVKDIVLITTPSALKIAKYSNNEKLKEEGYIGEGAWLRYWKDNCGKTFGICKTEKPSYYCIKDAEGKIINYRNVLTYQLINTIPFESKELEKIVEPEIEYVNRLKNDLDFFLQEINQLKNNAEEIEAEMNEDEEFDDNNLERGANIDVIGAFIEMSKRNSDFANTQVFKDYRRNFIDAYKGNLRKGKIRVEGTDYAVACGNPYEMLMATVGEFHGKSLTLKDNELYCSRFEDGEDVIGFRNPSINTGNIGVQVNKYSNKIHEYMNDTPNIVYLNSIDYPILSTYQGEDFDIDANLLTNHPLIVKTCKERIDKNFFSIPINKIKNTGKNDRELTPQNMSYVDHIISQNYIGSVINLSQELNSILNNAIYNGNLTNEERNEIYQFTSRLSSMSQCEIDKAKKQFEDLDVPKELAKIKECMGLVDNLEIRKLNSQIERLKQNLGNVKKEVMDYRSKERKPINKDIREIKEMLRINNLEDLAQDEINELQNNIKDLDNKVKTLEAEIKVLNDDILKLKENEKDDETIKIKEDLLAKTIEEINSIKKEKSKINKRLIENNIEKLTDKKVKDLNDDLEYFSILIESINKERQSEIDEVKSQISNKYKELSKHDKRRIKPYFFKFVGDNDAKKQRKATNKKHRKVLDKTTIEKFAKDNNIEVSNIDMENKDLVKLLKANDKIQKEWEDKIYIPIDTPMDWLQMELDKIDNKDKTGTTHVIKLIKKNKHKADEKFVNDVKDKITNLNNDIKGYRLNNELSYKDKLEKIRDAKKEVVEKLKKTTITKANMYGIMKECFTSLKNNGKVDKKSGIENLSLEILFKAYGTGLIDMFESNGANLE